jgi:transcriptional regulator PpsR
VTSRGTKYWSSGAIPLIAPELLGDIIATASDIAIVVSVEGTVLSVLVNPNHKTFGRLDHWEGRDLREFLTRESVPKLDARLQVFSEGSYTSKAVELNHTDVGGSWDFPVRYSFHRIGPDGTVLMLGRDLRPIAEMQQQLVKAQLALERDYEAQREFDTRYRVLMESSREAMVFVNLNSGRIVDVNTPAATMLGGTREDLVGAAFAQEFEGRRRSEFMESLTSNAMNEGNVEIELQARRSRRKILVSPTIFRASGERILLCRIDPAEEAEMKADELTENLSALYQEGVDAVVFTDREGVIRAANESFLNLADAAHLTIVKGRSLGEYLSRGSVDLKVLLENTARAGTMRLYATKLVSEYGTQTAVEMSATYLNDRLHPSFVFVIRDASRAEAVRKPGVAVSDDAVKSVMELVGSATLKDIVAETTDVVEKMCIETAIELTRNNRVAAAEMLGLSRQSLYVKLRKYGLIARDSAED